MVGSFKAAPALAILLLAGCETAPPYAAPEPPKVQTYTAPGIDSAVQLGSPPPDDWWSGLNSPVLNEVVASAVHNSPSVEIARAHLAAAHEMLNAARGTRSIQVDLTAAAERRKYGSYFLGPEAHTFPTFSAYSVAPGVSYDPDLFGARRHEIEANAAEADISRERLRAARLQVIGEAVTQAVAIASIRTQITVVHEVLAADEQTLDLVRSAHRVGVVSNIDVLQATSQRDADRTLLPPLYQSLDVAGNALAVLMGKAPAEQSTLDFELDQFNQAPEVSLELPSELVHTRPDIRAAEAQLHAASARVGIATADLYPRITLTADWAQEGLMSGGAASAWSLIGGVTAPVFHGGTLRARQRAAKADYEAAFAEYQLVVLKSFGQVADTLRALDHDTELLKTQQQALSSADSALGLTRQGYRVGNAGILQILTAQRSYELAELGVAQARAQRLRDTVALYLASGSG